MGMETVLCKGGIILGLPLTAQPSPLRNNAQGGTCP